VNAHVKIYNRQHYTPRGITHCARCGELLEDGDRIITRKLGNSYRKGFTSGTRPPVRGYVWTKPYWGQARAFHADTCYYAEPIAAK